MMMTGAEVIRSRDRATSRSISSTRSAARSRSALRRSPIRSANCAFTLEVVITAKRHGWLLCDEGRARGGLQELIDQIGRHRLIGIAPDRAAGVDRIRNHPCDYII